MLPELWQTENHHGITPHELHEKLVAFAEKEFDLRGNVPFLFVIDDGSHLIWVKTLWSNDFEKMVSTKFVRKLLEVSNARAYSHLVEAWVATEKAGPDGQFPENHVRPGDRPANERDDVMMVTTQIRGGDHLITRYLVTVREPQNRRGVRVDVDPGEGKYAGFMWNLFEAPQRTI